MTDMTHRIAAAAVIRIDGLAQRMRRALAGESGQGTVEYAGLAMAIGVLLLAVGSFLGGKDHGIGSIVVDAVKSAVQRASGSSK